ncbi:PD-(D/E)XK nuclease family protein [Trujillonella endophytica]|uniref:PD-(D/E)XK nuclease superfamily protein n=1 Tax=Trujillonella endophytica TaxID=673521 RepID=A0A1H8R202_9ACTN|nr:PD-(D/E)XK nuclease family protein [Trujillella endophytica]SEO59933.1 PD-(D/E)XK nuclease superfamily protein [Trujillella endophytica]
MHEWLERLTAVAVEWRAVSAAEQAQGANAVKQWRGRVAHLQATQRDLVQTGRWRGGPRTLLAALDQQYRELALTAGLAWLLRSDGHHGLGPAVLDGLLDYLAIDGSGTEAGVRVVLEEQRDETRADLIVYGIDWTIVVEAKTFAMEQDRQLDRLYRHWGNEPAPCFVFLTRGQRLPTTAVDSHGQWRALTWEQVADIARTAVSTRTGAAPGVHDYIATLEAYHRV